MLYSIKQLTSSLRMRSNKVGASSSSNSSHNSSIFDMELPIHSVVSGTVVTVTSSSTGSGSSHGFYRTSKWLCLLTTCLAFLLGVGVGVAVPVYFYALPVADVTTAVNGSTVNPMPNGNVPVPVTLTPFKSSTYSENIKGRIKGQRLKHLLRDNKGSSANSIASSAEDDDPSVVSFVEPSSSAESSSNSAERRQPDGAPAQHHSPSTGILTNASSDSEATDGIYWSRAVEDLLPAGFGDREAVEWRDFCQRSSVVRLEEGCGRMQNRLLTFENGTRSCCRYRQNYDQIQGEIFSFYLSRLIGLRNLPPSALGLVRPLDDRWADVRSSVSLAQWSEDRPVVYTQFLDDLEPAHIPVQLRGADRHLNPSDVQQRRPSNNDEDGRELVELAQWSDLLVFDYLTANLDRMVNNMYNMQWNSAMMDSPAHNLARNTRTGLLVFLDNESGLLHGYRLLDKYEVYHKSLLDSVCIFRRSTVDALRRLQTQRNIGDLLRGAFESQDTTLVDYLPFLPEKSVKTLNHRIDRVLDQVAKCQNIYANI